MNCAGDRLEELYRLHYRYVRGICRSVVRDVEDAEDAAIETFLKAQRHIEHLRLDAPGDECRKWLGRIAVTTCLDCLRRRKHVPQVAESEVLDARPVPGHERGVVLRLELERCLARIAEEGDRQCLLMRSWGFTREEIGEMIEESLSQVRTRESRAQKTMKECLQAKGIEAV
jgi:RNA polymerase sigma factor (sigma-70 family)